MEEPRDDQMSPELEAAADDPARIDLDDLPQTGVRFADRPASDDTPTPGQVTVHEAGPVEHEVGTHGVGTHSAVVPGFGRSVLDALPVRLSRWLERVPQRVKAAKIESWITFFVVAIAAGFVFVRLHPSKIFLDTLPAGGDMGAHVWGPAYLRDNLLPNFTLRGWTQDWYGGFPALHFYMVLPYLLIVLLDIVLPYGVAFKLIAVAGVVTIPISAYIFGRLARLPFPVPALLSVAGLLYVFDFNFTIYGGNIASTLAGEFAFSLSLSFALVFLGHFVRGLEDGTHRWWAALFLAATALSHLIPLAFAIGAAILIVAVRSLHRLPRLIGPGQTALVAAAGLMLLVATFRVTNAPAPRLAVLAMLVGLLILTDAARMWWAMSAGVAGMLLAGFWLFPFVARRPYLNDMGWEKLSTVRENLFLPEELGSGTHLQISWVLALAGVGAVLGVVFWHRMAMTWTAILVAAGFAFVHWPQNRLWNARFLGFWYLALYVLAAFGVYFVTRSIGSEMQRRWDERDPDRRFAPFGVAQAGYHAFRLGVPAVALVLAYTFLSLHLGLLPGGTRTDDGGYAWGPLRVSADDMNFVSGWANWNFSGYERKSAYPEYFNVITTMDEVGQEHGCGRAMWEFGREKLDQYGTPMAPMLLPHFTDGCIGSMEGLFFETSASVAQHFLLQSELSQDPSRPMRDLPYSEFDIDAGIDHMRIMGVSYYMAFSETAVEGANSRPDDLVPIADTDGWSIYQLTDTKIVEALLFEPAVITDVGHAGRDWTDPAVSWFNDERAREVVLVDDGPADWARVDLIPESDIPARAELAPRNQLGGATVSDVVIDDDRVSFTVDEVGVPVLVKIGYFPNWQVSGADTIYRATPNFMVVVPTSNQVVLEYKDSPVEYAGYAMTIAGIVMLIALGRVGRFNLTQLLGANGDEPHPVDADAGTAEPETPSDHVDELAAPGPGEDLGEHGQEQRTVVPPAESTPSPYDHEA